MTKSLLFLQFQFLLAPFCLQQYTYTTVITNNIDDQGPFKFSNQFKCID